MSTDFKTLGLEDSVVSRLSSRGIVNPTPIQEKALPPMLSGRHVAGQAQTGSGKTLAFALPILTRVDPSSPATQALVIAPTRELVLQISEVFWETRVRESEVRVVPVYGGADRDTQRSALSQGAQVIVATPGRLIDFIWSGDVSFDSIRMVILDEADRMLDMGFVDDVKFILSCLRSKPQIGLFSATMPDALHQIIREYLPDPVYIRLQHSKPDKPKIEQHFYRAEGDQKFKILKRILNEEKLSTLIFCRTRTGADRLAEKLTHSGHLLGVLHGGKNQSERTRALRGFRKGHPLTLVATDIASRGLDIQGMERVVNYDVPLEPEDYVHRIGRTARAGREGVAVTLVTRKEAELVKRIERLIGQSIVVSDAPGGSEHKERTGQREERSRMQSKFHQSSRPRERF